MLAFGLDELTCPVEIFLGKVLFQTMLFVHMIRIMIIHAINQDVIHRAGQHPDQVFNPRQDGRYHRKGSDPGAM